MNKSDLEQLLNLDAINNELSRRSLYEFVKQAWRFADPAQFIDGWHISAICEHLEACAKRQIKNLLINIPPRHSKSLLTCVFFPAWLWIEHPDERILSASYSIDLSRKDSRLCRQLMLSDWYRKNFGGSFKLRKDQNEKSDYENNKGGARRATSVGGGGTGLGGSIIIIDDPLKAIESSSENERQNVIDWWNQTISTRLNDPETGVRIVIMQRLHENDLAGHILKNESEWDRLILPARFESDRRCVTSIGWCDPRVQDGQLLVPNRFNESSVASLEKQLGSWAAAGQLQQRPSPREGGNIKAHWFRYVIDMPMTMEQIVLSIDCGNKTEKKNDPTAIGVWGKFGGRHYRIDEWRQRVDFPALKAAVISLCAKWNPTAVLIEDAASGTQLMQWLRGEPEFSYPIPPLPVPTKNKAIRLDAVSPMIEAGFVILPQGSPWTADYIAEMTGFPMGAHDDRVDETSQYLAWARGGRDFDEILKSVAVAGIGVSAAGVEDVYGVGVAGGRDHRDREDVFGIDDRNVEWE